MPDGDSGVITNLWLQGLVVGVESKEGDRYALCDRCPAPNGNERPRGLG
jgi:hypothetical protein